MTQPKQSVSLATNIKFYAVIAVILLFTGNAIYNFYKKHDNYSKCVAIWHSTVTPIRITSYDPNTGEPNYRWPEMTKEFRSRCYASLDK